jgi:hypothetical protein
MFTGITADTPGPRDGWVNYVNKCYELEMVPFLRLAGVWAGNQWLKPEADAPGDYTSMAQAIKRVVEGLPRSNMCPMYIEVFNEPNLSVEWTGKPVAKEYADFFVAVSKAIRSIGDDRIKILNAGLALSPEWTRLLCEANPEFIDAFDVWSTHPYPMNHPPSINHHDGTAKETSLFTIDSYVKEVDVLNEFGRMNVPVMITETGWDLGNSVYLQSEGYPIIDEYNRADYIMRSFRDYWSKWDEIQAVFPFEFSNEGWQRFDWVYPESGINPDGTPTKPHYQYTVVAALAKPTDTTGAINGTLTVDQLGVRLEGVKVTGAGQEFTTDPMGNYFLADVEPGTYTVEFNKTGFTSVTRNVEVKAGENSVLDVPMKSKRKVALRGFVYSGDTSRPLAGVTVKLEPSGKSAKTDAIGQYLIEGCIPARYSLQASLDKHYNYRVDDMQLKVDEENRHDFRMGRKGDIPGGNMLNNPSMEAGGGGGGQHWIALGFEPLIIAKDLLGMSLGKVSRCQSHTGRQSQSLQMFEVETTIRQITHYGTADVGTKYRAGIWVRTEGVGPDGAAWITFDATENSGAVVARLGPSKMVKGTSKWTWLSLEGVAPVGSERLSLNLHTKGPGGVAYFDDAFVGPVTDDR